jgi:3-phenylpropionate/trans-cinnamate dioxygenase ferredoxin subunit
MSASKKYTWHKVAEMPENIEWQSNGICLVDVEGKKISLAKFQDQLFAFSYKCPHAGGIMADGFVDAVGNVVCPVHRYKFNMQNGRNTTGEGYYLKTYPVEQRNEGVFIGIEEKGFFKWR